MAVTPVAGDDRFFVREGPHDLATVAGAAGATAVGRDGNDRTARFTGVAPLSTAGPSEISFLDNRRYTDLLAGTKAGAVIVHPDLAARVPATSVPLVTREVYLGWARVAALFHPLPPLRPGVHPAAIVDPSASIDPTAEIGPFAVIGARAGIGPRCRLAPHVVIGDGVELGADCRIGSHASVSHALVGARVYIYPGARIGQEGFGFATGPAGFVSIPQLGRVILEDDVEVGANSAVDRGSAQDTVIGAGTRLDNLVQVGHNVRIGRCCAIVAQVGISGSTILGDFVQVAGQAAFSGHLRIGNRVQIGGQAGVMADLADGARVVGSPAMPWRTFFRQVATLSRLAEAGRSSGVRKESSG
jgi:UDP-3-O-[3-hydroxymyristoyl] glucosamine N-acyltransferase